jgi:glycosyltransferase involved in cell wall biosynthesis/ribosomal protein S18 acetylase RimI-like enzyme
MKIWLINPYGPIPGEGWRDYRFTVLGKVLAARGHDVIWWTANFSHHFKKYRSEGWKDVPVTKGFRIRLVPTTAYARNIGLGRLRYEAVFAGRTYHRGTREKPPDCVVGVEPPQIVGFASVRLARRHRVPLVLDVFDRWPELFVLAFPRAIRPLAPVLLSPLFALRRHDLRHADAVTALCDTYLEVARAAAPRLRSALSLTVFNGIDLELFRSAMATVDEVAVIAGQMGKAAGEVWAIYAGSLGNNYDVQTLLDAAVLLQGRQSRIRILIAGEGPLRPQMTRFMEAKRLGNAIYLGTISHRELVQRYQLCDIGLCTYAPESNVGMPDKAYDYMAAGLPLVNSLRGELEQLLIARDMGIQYQAGNAVSLADALERLASDPGGRQRMAQNSYRAATGFDLHAQYARYADLIEKVSASDSIEGTASPVTTGSVAIRPMKAVDVQRVVEIHLSSFPGFFLSFLGPRFLRLFYAEAVALNEIALVACDDATVIGFVMGSVGPGMFFRALLGRKLIAFAIASFPAMLRRPSASLRIARALAKPKRATKLKGTATLLSLGVSPSSQRLGAGKALVRSFLEAAARRGSQRVDLTTDKLDNDRTNHFYASLGFQVAREIVTPERRVLNEYEIDLPSR